MNFFILTLILALPFLSNCQDLPVRDGKVFYETIDSTSANKDELYKRAKLWFVNSFKDSKSVLQIDNKDDGQLVGKSNIVIPYKYVIQTSALCNFTFKVDLKDSKYRLQVYNILYKWAMASNQEMSIEEMKTVYKGRYYKVIALPTDERIKMLISSFNDAMKKSTIDNF